ncbi:retrovirus-related pol polyprotein from transposon TNT 1-94 [Tanacetum coccineum]
MKKVHRLLSMTDGDERKYILDYTHVDLHYVEDERKNLVNKFNLLKQEISLNKSELSKLINTVSINCSLQNKVIKVNLENESLKDEISDLKKVIEKWTCSKVTLDQLLSVQVPGNIVKSLGGKGRRKEKISSKEVVFTKVDESSSMLAPEITSDSESECDTQEPLPPLPKLIGATPTSTSRSLISQTGLTFNMVDLSLNTHVPKKTKVSPSYVIKKKTESKLSVVPELCTDKKVDSSIEQLLLTLMEEVKGLKKQIEIPSSTSPSNSQSSSKSAKQKTWFGPCKHCWFKNHLSDDCYAKPKCSTYGSSDHLTKEHIEHAAVKKSLIKIKAQSPLNPSSRKAHVILKPFKECKYYGFNDHYSDHYEFYPGCKVCGSIAHEPSNCPKKHPNSRRPRIANRQSELTKKVAYVNGPKDNLISISQLCDANYKVLFTKTQGTIYNQNNEVVLIAPRRRDVYVIDMSSFNKESNACFFAKASPSVNWLWHKRLSHLNFKNISAISMFLGVLFIFTIIGTIWESLIKKLMMDSFLATLRWLKLSGCLTSEDKKWKKQYMLHSAKMMKPFLNPTLKVMESTSMKTKPFQMMNSLNQGVKLLNDLISVIPKDLPKFTNADDHPALSDHNQLESADHFESADHLDSAECFNKYFSLQMQCASAMCKCLLANASCKCNVQMQCANACLQMQAANAMYKCNVHMQAANAMCKLQ